MPAAPPANPGTSAPVRSAIQTSLPQRTYGFRVLGMGLGGIPLVTVMLELGSPWPAWVWVAFCCVLWPHIAYLLARRSADPFRAELRNFVIDSFVAGSWVPLMHFNVLPSAVLLTVVTADKVNSGIRRLWLHSLPGTLVAMLVAGAFTGFALQPQTNMPVILACLPILVIHTLAVSLSSYRLVRRVQVQNQQLAQLTRVDALTGLESRGHWEKQAAALLVERGDGDRATLMLLDVDRFKEINDRHGHAVGDDVLRGVADLVRRTMPAGSHAGRLGGDEFALVLPIGIDAAALIAEQIRAAAEMLDFPNTPSLRFSVSLGIAAPPQAGNSLREWLEDADRALYRAKNAGRNRAMGATPVAS